jgi:hypothetical protein
MKYIDPHPVTCRRCSANSVQRVANLLRLRATCPACGAPLDELGYEMRARCDDWGEFCTLAEIVVRLEDSLGKEISDAELEGVRTLRAIARVVRAHLPPDSDQETRSIELVRDAAKSVPWCSVAEVILDAPLMEAVDPGRWNRE